MMAIFPVILPYSMSFHAADDITINLTPVPRKPVFRVLSQVRDKTGAALNFLYSVG